MNALRKLLLTVTAVLSWAPTAAFAYPPQCDDVCFYETAHCGDVCYFGLNERTTCAGAGYCSEASSTSVEPTDTVMEVRSHQPEDAAPVCNDAHLAQARTASFAMGASQGGEQPERSNPWCYEVCEDVCHGPAFCTDWGCVCV